MTVSLLEILAAARSHAAPLAAESAGYLLLAVADHVVAAPRVVAPDDVELRQDGSVSLRSRSAVDPARAEQLVRRLLARTLEVSSSVGPALRRAAERREDTGLTALVRELEVALIPVNRGAAKRALSRLHRETERARDAGKLGAGLEAERAVAAEAAVPAPIEPPSAPPVAIAAPVAAAISAPLPAAAELPEPSPVALPAVVAVAPPTRSAAPRQPAAAVELTLTPPPHAAEPAPAVTRPEPVVLRARERGNSTPRLGTVVTAQTLPGEDAERTERAPDVVSVDDDPESDLAIDVDIEVSVEEPAESDSSDDELTPVRAITSAADPEPPSDPEPSQLPDVLTAMLELHTGLDADEAPTRLREVVTELLAVVQPVPLLTPEPQQVEDAWLTQSSLEDVASVVVPEPETPGLEAEVYDPELHEAATWNPAPVAEIAVAPVPVAPVAVVPATPVVPAVEPVPEMVLYRFESELAEPAEHEALTWYPAPVTSALSPLPPALLVAEPLPDFSPYAPAVLPAQSHEVAELVDSFYVSGGAEEIELRSALKEMAGLELTPMPRPSRF